VSIAADTLRIFTIEQLGQMFNQTTYPLRYTPRRLLVHPVYPNLPFFCKISIDLLLVLRSKLLVVAESDNDVYPKSELDKIREAQKQEDNQFGNPLGLVFSDLALICFSLGRGSVKMEVDGEIVDEPTLPDELGGVARAGNGKWAACIRLMDVGAGKTLDLSELENNETITSACWAEFLNTTGETYLCIGTAKDLKVR